MIHFFLDSKKIEKSDENLFDNNCLLMSDGQILAKGIIFPNNDFDNKLFIEILKSHNVDKIKSFLDEISYRYSIVVLYKNFNHAYLFRDFSGNEALFYSVNEHGFQCSNSFPLLEKTVNSNNFNIEASYEMFAFEFMNSEDTFLKDIKSVPNDAVIKIDIYKKHSDLYLDNFADKFVVNQINENDFRSVISKAHEVRLGRNNAILLSGGIDSQVMSIILKKDLDVQSLSSITFDVLGASESEAHVAKEIATNLDIKHEVIPIDPTLELNYDDLFSRNYSSLSSYFIEEIIKKTSFNFDTLFSGQDSRIHTPVLEKLDEKFHANHNLVESLSLLIPNYFVKNASNNAFNDNKFKKHKFFEILLSAGNYNEYFIKRFLNFLEYPFTKNGDHFDIKRIKEYKKLYSFKKLDFRNLWNNIVQLKYRRQHLFDMGCVTEPANRHDVIAQLPFFDKSFTNFSASLNYEKASKFTSGRDSFSGKKVMVNKLTLREAFIDDLDEKFIFRKKAVCRTNYLFFNNSLDPLLEDFLADKKFIQDERLAIFNLKGIEDYIKKSRHKWTPEHNGFLQKLFNLLTFYWKYRKHFD